MLFAERQFMIKIIAIAFLLGIFLAPNVSAIDWMNATFQQRKYIEVNISDGNTEQYYPILLNITTSGTNITGWDGIRFANSTHDAIPYYIQENRSGYAEVWVNVTNINGTIWIYYGNTSTTETTSNGNTTFSFFDNAEDTSIIWNNNNNERSTTQKYEGSYSYHQDASGGSETQYLFNTAQGFPLSYFTEVVMYDVDNSQGSSSYCGTYDSGGGLPHTCVNFKDGNIRYYTGGWVNAETDHNSAEWYKFRMEYNGTTHNRYRFYINDTLYTGWITPATTMANADGPIIYGEANPKDSYADRMIIGKYYNPEPTFTFGAEELISVDLNLTVLNAENLTNIGSFDVNISNTTFGVYNTSIPNPFYENVPDVPNGSVSIETYNPGYTNGTNTTSELGGGVQQNITILVYPINEIRAENSETGASINLFTATIANATDSIIASTSNGTIQISGEVIPHNAVTISFISSGYNSSSFSRTIDSNNIINESFKLPPAGFHIDVFDENTLDDIYFNITMSNSTFSETLYNVTNVTRKISNMTTGDVTLYIEEWNETAQNYYPRYYYVTLNENTNLSMNGYLLKVGDGIIVRFNMRDCDGSALDNALVTAKKSFSGVFETVEQAYSDSSGTATMFLDPTTSYNIKVEYGSFSETVTIMPSQTDYTYVICIEDEIEFDDLFYGIIYSWSPNWRLPDSMTYINFTLSNLFGSLGNLENYGLQITYNNTLLYNITITNQSYGGTIYGNINLTNATLNEIVNATGWFTKVNYSTYYIYNEYAIYNSTLLYNTSAPTLYGAINSMLDVDTGLSNPQLQFLVVLICLFFIGSTGLILNSWFGGGMMALGIIAIFTYFGVFALTDFIIVTFGVIGIYVIRSGFG